jgi:predicted HNH restriction endonuclease
MPPGTDPGSSKYRPNWPHLARLGTILEPSISKSVYFGTWPDVGLVEAAVVDVDQTALEGASKLAAHFRRERNQALIDAKRSDVLRRYGKLECEVCGFNFNTKYGELEKDFVRFTIWFLCPKP